MSIAAVPDYLGTDFSTVAPGHRFNLYFRGWERDRQGALAKLTNKASAVDGCLRLTANDKNNLAALAQRQQHLAGEHVWRLPAKTVAPLTTGLGIEHPLENGFAFLNPYGLPYLPGSGIKGVLRAAARELYDDDPESGWDEATIDALFGPDTGDEARRGALIFWDAFPAVTQSLMTEIMTPHQTHYYQDGQPPHDSGQPNPILFVAIPPQTPLTFYVDCNRALLPDALREDSVWQELLRAAFEYACDWLGFGAKTAVGYGHLAIDTRELSDWQEQQQQAQAQADAQARVEQATAGLPADAQVIEAQVQRGGWSNNEDFIDWMEAWIDDLPDQRVSPQAWERVEQQMSGHFDKGILVDPEAMRGKKNNKPKYEGRKKMLAQRLLGHKPNGDNA